MTAMLTSLERSSGSNAGATSSRTAVARTPGIRTARRSFMRRVSGLRSVRAVKCTSPCRCHELRERRSAEALGATGPSSLLAPSAVVKMATLEGMPSSRWLASTTDLTKDGVWRVKMMESAPPAAAQVQECFRAVVGVLRHSVPPGSSVQASAFAAIVTPDPRGGA